MFAAFLRSLGKLVCIPTLLLCLSGVTGSAQVTLDFESLSSTNDPGGYNGQPNPVILDGFLIGTNFGNMHSVSPDGSVAGYNYTGSVALFSGGDGSTVTLARQDGNPFTLNAIDIANLQPSTAGVSVLFSGNLQGGGTVTQSFTHGANDSLETVTFDSSWTNLASVTFNQNSPYNQFDNIVLDGGAPAATTTPEPGMMALFGAMAVTGAGFLRRRRRK